MLTQEMKDTVDKQRLGFVATVSQTGEPNLSPKGTFVVVDDRTLAFGDIRSPGTVSNLLRQAAVAVDIVDPLGRKGLRAKGTATILDRDSDGYGSHRARFDRWGAMAGRIKHIVLIEVLSAKPLSSPSYVDGAREADLRAQWKAILLAD